MSTQTVERPAPVVGSPRRAQAMTVVGLVSGLLAVTLVLGPLHLATAPYLTAVELPWWTMLLAFAATETFVLRIQARRETQTISFSEVPLVLGLFFATLPAMVVGRVLACAAVMVARRRSPPLKIVFNLAMVTAQTVLAVAVFQAVAPLDPVAGPGAWLAAYAAALLADALGALAIACIISVYDGGVNILRLLSDAGSLVVPAMGVTLGLLAVTSIAASTTSSWLLLACGLLLLAAFRVYASLAERHLNLERMYRFSQAVTSSPEVDAIMGNVLAEARELLRCERATAVFVADAGHVARITLGSSGRLIRSEEPDSPDEGWVVRHVVDGGTPLLIPRTTKDPDARAWLQRNELRDAVVVPLTGGAGVVGALVVADRLGDVRTFDQDDVLLLETVANHASVALRNGELIGRLRHDSLHDTLTGLPNRAQLQRAMTAALDEVAAGRAPGATVMILDLDQFKEVNDTLGHHQGDTLLVEVAARLTTAVGELGTVARLGGDEFAVLLPRSADEDRALRVGRRIVRALEQPVALDGLEVEVGASVGIALAPHHATDPAALLKRADVAMYGAKSSGRRVRLYEPDQDVTDPRRLTLVSELRAALQDGSIAVHVQPKARLDSGRVVGVEALVRWDHPELGWVPPEEFVGVAERSGLIGLLTTRVLDAALAACADWRRHGLDLDVAVNLSARSLQDADLVEEVTRLLRRHGVPADRLTLEVTEGSVMADPARAVALLHQLRDLGVRLSVDDFGTGYSSLSYLQRLPVQEVKIDRSFVSALREDGENVAIVRAIVDLGRHLGLEVIAEGVEDDATWRRLAAMGCDLAQGWHIARPMPIEELAPWLAARSASGPGALRIV
jgi:diguanylate cyclase (GGDEF)-like protein